MNKKWRCHYQMPNAMLAFYHFVLNMSVYFSPTLLFVHIPFREQWRFIATATIIPWWLKFIIQVHRNSRRVAHYKWRKYKKNAKAANNKMHTEKKRKIMLHVLLLCFFGWLVGCLVCWFIPLLLYVESCKPCLRAIFLHFLFIQSTLDFSKRSIPPRVSCSWVKVARRNTHTQMSPIKWIDKWRQ